MWPHRLRNAISVKAFESPHLASYSIAGFFATT